MSPRCQSFPVRLLLLACIVAWSTANLDPQTIPTGTSVEPAPLQTVIKINARTVVLDVVVTGKDGQPIQGLTAQDFSIAEDGKPQTITFFEEHSPAKLPATTPVTLPELPPNTFTNIPQLPPADSLTVLLLDSLNTQQNDQRFVKQQILAFLKTAKPGRRMAIFTLGTQLRFVQGFSDDPAALATALNNPHLGVNPTSSPLLQSDQEKNVNQQIIAAMAVHDAAGASAMAAFLTEQKVEQTDVRTRLTLAAFQEIGHYLAGFPGRKNIVWFSGSFPLTLFPPPGSSIDVQRSNDEEVKKTDALLSAAQVAVYPIAAQGVAASVIFDADHQLAGVANAQQARQQITNDVQAETTDRNAADASMDQIAHDTGGIAIKNTNGLADAIDRALQHGSAYYTLSYTPANAATDGRFRKVRVNLTGAARSKGVQLAYRQGYYATDAKSAQKLAAGTPQSTDPLRPLMDLGMPASTQVPLLLRVQRSPADSDAAGDNSALQETRTRYTVTFILNAKDLQFHADPDGSRHDRIEATLLVYDHDGKPLNWLVRELSLDMDAARFARVQNTGIHFKLEIDAPKDGSVLRSGVYDLDAEKAGTLEVALGRITAGPPEEAPTSFNLTDNLSTRTTTSAATGTATGPAQPASTNNAIPTPTPHPAASTIAPGTANPTTGMKTRSLAFWSQPAQNVDPVLLHVPADNQSRYEHLRQDFKALHCTAAAMEEQPIARKDSKNLICTLPGKDTTAPIVVAARYDRMSGNWGANQRWGEAVMLPLLFNALRAEPREHTFVFVALDGEAGVKTFFEEFHRKSAQSPSSLVVLDALGLGAPKIYTSDQTDFTKKSRQRVSVNHLLASEAIISATVMGTPNPVSGSEDGRLPGRRALMQSTDDPNANWIIEREDELPSILIHSAPASSVSSSTHTLSTDAFHKDFDFIAYLLCRIDLRLAAGDETAASSTAKVHPEKQ